MRVAIIGAGLAGAACAQTLSACGHDVIIFDKGRGAGGRLSTRRVKTELGSFYFDHGAQFITAEQPGFQSLLKQAVKNDVAQAWYARLVSIDRSGNIDALKDRARYIGIGGMSKLAQYALKDKTIEFNRHASYISRSQSGWQIHFKDGVVSPPFDQIVFTLPAEQLIDLLARCDDDFSHIIKQAKSTHSRPCWSVMIALADTFDPGFDGAKIYGGAIRWMARMASKPGAPATEAIVIHASPDWSEQFLEEDPKSVITILCEEAYIRFGLPKPVWATAHRWRYAMVSEPLNHPYILNKDQSIGVAGDWCLDNRAEAAWMSGQALGQAIVS